LKALSLRTKLLTMPFTVPNYWVTIPSTSECAMPVCPEFLFFTKIPRVFQNTFQILCTVPASFNSHRRRIPTRLFTSQPKFTQHRVWLVLEKFSRTTYRRVPVVSLLHVLEALVSVLAIGMQRPISSRVFFCSL
jgi:hypothetical protein